MPRYSTLFAVLVPLVAGVLFLRSLNASARFQLSWPLALHPDGSDDGIQVPVGSDAPVTVKHTSTGASVDGSFRRRIVAVGDLHGDLHNAYKVLNMAGVVDAEGDWSGDVDFFVQTGDIIDRCVCNVNSLPWLMLKTLLCAS